MGAISALNAAQTGLTAASLGIESTSNNVANAANDGYSRRAVRTTNGGPVSIGGHPRGAGVVIDRIARSTDYFVTKRIVDTSGKTGEAAAHRDALHMAETWFSETDMEGLTTRMQGFYDSLTAATSDPGNTAVRRAVVNSASTFAAGISRTAGALVDIQGELEDRVGDMVSQINDRLADVADLNERIVESGSPEQAADLMDRRDELVRTLADELGAELLVDRETGEATVLLGGVALVQGDHALTVAAGQNAAGDLTLIVDSIGDLDAGSQVGGRIGGMIKGWSDLEGYLDELDTMVEDLGGALNTQHSLGFDLNGNPGGDILSWDAAANHLSTTVDVDANLSASTLALASNPTASLGDIGNLQALLDIENQQLFGTQTGEQFINSLVTLVGSDVRSAEADVEHYGTVLADLDMLRESISGVDLDEEAVKLIEYQTAYQAAAKMISAADTMMQTLFQL